MDMSVKIMDELARVSRAYGDRPPTCIILGAAEIEAIVNDRETDRRFRGDPFSQLSFQYRNWIVPIYAVPVPTFFSLAWQCDSLAYYSEVNRK